MRIFFSREFFKNCSSAKVYSREISLDGPTAKVFSREMQKFRGFFNPRKFLPAKVSDLKVYSYKVKAKNETASSYSTS